jgi:hypothetical protein
MGSIGFLSSFYLCYDLLSDALPQQSTSSSDNISITYLALPLLRKSPTTNSIGICPPTQRMSRTQFYGGTRGMLPSPIYRAWHTIIFQLLVSVLFYISFHITDFYLKRLQLTSNASSVKVNSSCPMCTAASLSTPHAPSCASASGVSLVSSRTVT